MKNLLILTLFVFISILYFSDVSAQSLGMSITATADRGSESITVTGKTISDITEVTFRVTSPSRNNVVAVVAVSPDDNGEFMVKLVVGPTWTENGFYEIEVMQAVYSNSMYTLHVFVEVNDRMTEKTFVTDSNLVTNLATNLVPQISVQTNDRHYNEGDTIVISGKVVNISGETPVIIQIFHDAIYVHLAQSQVAEDGSFTETVLAEGATWKESGEYRVRASYQGNITETEFRYTPESNLGAGNFPEACVGCSMEDAREKAKREANSKCGPGTVFDPDANSCVLNPSPESEVKLTERDIKRFEHTIKKWNSIIGNLDRNADKFESRGNTERSDYLHYKATIYESLISHLERLIYR